MQERQMRGTRKVDEFSTAAVASSANEYADLSISCWTVSDHDFPDSGFGRIFSRTE